MLRHFARAGVVIPDGRIVCLAGILVVAGLTPAWSHQSGVSNSSRFHGVAPNCPARPPTATGFEIRFVIDNNPRPTSPSDAAFPRDFCPSGSISYGTAEARGTTALLGTFTMHDRYCIRPPSLTGAAEFTAEDGDKLETEYVATVTEFPPPFPNAEFTGSGTVTGGSGAFAGATGAFGIAGRQLGVLIPGTNIAVHSAFIFCGYINGR